MRSIVLSLTLSVVLAGQALSQEDDSGGGGEEIEAPEAPNSSLPLIAINCKYVGGDQNFSVGFDANNELFKVSFQECSVTRANPDSLLQEPSYLLKVPVELSLNRRADVSKCNNFALATMLEIKDKNPDFDWSGINRFISDVEISNLNGTSMNFGHFMLHDKLKTTGVTIGSHFLGGNDKPNYDDVFFGTIRLDGIESLGETSKFGDELARVTPVVGKGKGQIDYTLEIEVRLFLPRAVCYERTDDAAQNEGKPAAINHDLVATKK